MARFHNHYLVWRGRVRCGAVWSGQVRFHIQTKVIKMKEATSSYLIGMGTGLAIAGILYFIFLKLHLL